MSQTTAKKSTSANVSKTIAPRIPSFARQESAWGAGGTGAIIVIAQHAFNGTISNDVITAAATIVGLIATWIASLYSRHRYKKKMDSYKTQLNIDMQNLKRDAQAAVDDTTLPEETRKEIATTLHNTIVIDINTRHENIITKQKLIISSDSFPESM